MSCMEETPMELFHPLWMWSSSCWATLYDVYKERYVNILLLKQVKSSWIQLNPVDSVFIKIRVE